MRREVALALALTACTTEEACERRRNAAQRDAVRDAALCLFDPLGVDEPECGGAFDRRPLDTYYGVWCATAELSCIEQDREALVICFGDEETAPGEEFPP